MDSHTVRIISHKSDIRSRKELIIYMKSGGSREHGCRISTLHSVSQSTFEYECRSHRTTIDVIDCDYDTLLDASLTSNDIIYVDLSGQGDDNSGKITWVNQFEDTEATIWYFSGLFGKTHNLCKNAINSCYGCKETWLKYIDQKFGIKESIQSVTKLFSTNVAIAPKYFPDAPWPLPKIALIFPSMSILARSNITRILVKSKYYLTSRRTGNKFDFLPLLTSNGRRLRHYLRLH